jgi:acyl-CoA thioesterase
MTEDELARNVAAAMYAKDHAAQALGIGIEHVAAGEARVGMLVRRDMLNGHGTCHGGLTFTLADTAFAYACNSRNRASVALRADISFMAAGKEGERLVAHARARREGRAGIYDVEVTAADGRLVALFRGTSYEIKGGFVPQE